MAKKDELKEMFMQGFIQGAERGFQDGIAQILTLTSEVADSEKYKNEEIIQAFMKEVMEHLENEYRLLAEERAKDETTH
jgi:hypothetical protein